MSLIQRRLAALLADVYKPRAVVHGFVSAKGILTNARVHQGRRYVLNLDLEDFFPSIHHGRVSGAMRAIGFAPGVAKLISHVTTYQGKLPQGAPSSPIISNVVCWTLDKRLTKLAKEHTCQFTRYADDITFSTFSGAFPKPLAEVVDGKLQLGGKLTNAIVECGFAINQKKTRIAGKDRRQEVTGLTVNGQPNVDRRFIRNIRAALYSWKQDPAGAHKKFVSNYARSRPPMAKVPSLEEHLRGKLGHLAFVRGHFDSVYAGLRDTFNTLAAVPIPKKSRPPDPWLNRLRRAVWVIESHGEPFGVEDTCQGSATFLEGVGLVTCLHCISPKYAMVAYRQDASTKKYPVQVVKSEAAIDLAILSHSIPASEYETLPFDLTAIKTHGEDVTLVGWPDFGDSDDITIRDGVVVGSKMVSELLPVSWTPS